MARIQLNTCYSRIRPEMEPVQDDVIGVFESGGLSSGFPAGYRLLVKQSRLVGQKAYLGTYSWWATYPSKNADTKVREKASKLASEIESKKQFEINKSELEGVEFKPASFWKSGYIKFTVSGRNEITIKVSGSCTADLLTNLAKSLRVFADEKLRLVQD